MARIRQSEPDIMRGCIADRHWDLHPWNAQERSVEGKHPDSNTVYPGSADYHRNGVCGVRKKDHTHLLLARRRMPPDYGRSLHMAWHNGFQAYPEAPKTFLKFFSKKVLT